MIESVSAEKSRSAFRNVLLLFGRALISERAVYEKQNAREKKTSEKKSAVFFCPSPKPALLLPEPNADAHNRNKPR